MKLSVGDTIIGTHPHNDGIIREILEVRKTGYTWKYPESDADFWSENSSDPFFVMGWELVNERSKTNGL